MTAPVHPLVPAQSKPGADTSATATTDLDTLLCVLSAEGACAEAPLTSEPPLPDAEPLTSEPPLYDLTPLTSEPSAAAGPDPTGY
ncbi:hypothetical protein ABZ845_20365 [Streptomyces sp. NPDC047022]|uniref:hypothetical protein n=1 Tax=Streptomyces sp. NPDC047022 TaxID=3155737 RepID=UPI0033F96FF5